MVPMLGQPKVEHVYNELFLMEILRQQRTQDH